MGREEAEREEEGKAVARSAKVLLKRKTEMVKEERRRGTGGCTTSNPCPLEEAAGEKKKMIAVSPQRSGSQKK